MLLLKPQTKLAKIGDAILYTLAAPLALLFVGFIEIELGIFETIPYQFLGIMSLVSIVLGILAKWISIFKESTNRILFWLILLPWIIIGAHIVALFLHG
jgi:hypothetical protein